MTCRLISQLDGNLIMVYYTTLTVYLPYPEDTLICQPVTRYTGNINSQIISIIVSLWRNMIKYHTLLTIITMYTKSKRRACETRKQDQRSLIKYSYRLNYSYMYMYYIIIHPYSYLFHSLRPWITVIPQTIIGLNIYNCLHHEKMYINIVFE